MTGKVRIPRVKMPQGEIVIRECPLGDADVLAARSWLGYLYGTDNKAAQSAAESALAIDRTNVLARLMETKLTHAITPEDARATAAAHPDDWRALRLVDAALHGSPEGNAALDRLCSLAENKLPECNEARDRTGVGASDAASK